MWCNKCHYGSDAMKKIPVKCPMCRNDEFTDENPLPSRPSRSIRAMNRRQDPNFDQKRKNGLVLGCPQAV